MGQHGSCIAAIIASQHAHDIHGASPLTSSQVQLMIYVTR
jgi:hypothetical protein